LYANPKPTADLFDHAPIVAGMARAVVRPKCKICSTKKYIAPLSHGRSHHIRPFMVRLFRMYVVSLT
jgi:hypothetical protein